jgi:protease-4
MGRGGYPPPKKRFGGWKLLFIALLILALGASVLLNFGLLSLRFSLAGGGAGSVQTSVRSAGNSHQQIAVIPIEGLIDETTEGRFEKFMAQASGDEDVKALVILIDTPGGTVTASDEMYKLIKKFKSDHNVPIVVAMRGMATSGGYYAACAADYIVAERTTLTGNIGVLMPRYNISKLMDKYGVEDNTTVATGAIYKDAGSPTRATKPADDAYLQKEIDGAFTIFKQVVVEGRGKRLTKTIDEIANGMAYSGNEALDLGLVDKIDDTGYLDAAIAYATKQASLSSPEVVVYHEQPPLLANLLSGKYAGNQPSAGGGVSINLDASVLDKMAPRMMYLYPGAR